MYTIKRYANGRLFDAEEKAYIRREQVAGMIAAKKEFVILDTKTGKDVTEEVTAQILAREGRRKKRGARAAGARKSGKQAGGSQQAKSKEEEAAGPLLDFLRKSGDSLYQWGKKYAARGQDLLAESWRELDKRINRLVSEKKLSDSEGRDMKEEIFRHSENLRGWLGQRVEKAVEEMVDRMNLATRDELQAVEEKIDALNERVQRLEKEGSGKSGD